MRLKVHNDARVLSLVIGSNCCPPPVSVALEAEKAVPIPFVSAWGQILQEQSTHPRPLFSLPPFSLSGFRNLCFSPSSLYSPLLTHTPTFPCLFHPLLFLSLSLSVTPLVITITPFPQTMRDILKRDFSFIQALRCDPRLIHRDFSPRIFGQCSGLVIFQLPAYYTFK